MNIRQINLNTQKAYHAASHKGSGIIFAVLDTGVKPIAYLDGRVSHRTKADLNDTVGHGTFVAGLLLEWCPDAKIRAYNVLPGGKGKAEDIIEALRDVYLMAKDSPDRWIVNMSLSGNYNPDSQVIKDYERAIDRLVEIGVPVVVAAGNQGVQELNAYPSCFQSPITVSAVFDDGQRANFSTWHNEVDFCALGVSVKGLSISTGAATATKSGTSVACPMLAGVVGLMLSKNPKMTEPALYEELKRLTIDLGAGGRDPYFGWGVVDLLKAAQPPKEGNMLSTVIDTGLKWGARKPRTKTDHIQIHHTVGNYGTPERWAGLHASKQKDGQQGVPYSYLVLEDGKIFLGRGHEYSHGGVKDSITNNANQRSIAIALNGDKRNGLPDKQRDAAVRLTKELMTMYGVSEVLGHNEIPLYSGGKPTGKTYATLCPSIDMTAFRAALGGVKPEPTPEPTPAPFPALYNYTGATYVNVRAGAGTNHAVVGQLKAGQQCIALSAAGDWVEVVLHGENPMVRGWCTEKYLRRAR